MNWQSHVEHLISIRQDSEAVRKYLDILAHAPQVLDTNLGSYDEKSHNDDSKVYSTILGLVTEHINDPDAIKEITDMLVKIVKYQRDNDLFYTYDMQRTYYGNHIGGDTWYNKNGCLGLKRAILMQDVMHDYYKSIGCTWCNG